MNPTCPKLADHHVATLLSRIGIATPPVQVRVCIDPIAKIENCYNNVMAKISKESGGISYGWVIWKFDYWYEAEHHAVWIDTNGIPIDITPRPFEIDTIMFVEDNDRKYAGSSFVNVRLNSTSDRIIDDLIAVRDCVDSIWLMGKRIDESTILLPENYISAINKLKMIEAGILHHMQNSGTLRSPCFCDSGIAYQHCHGNGLAADMKSLKERIYNLISNNS